MTKTVPVEEAVGMVIPHDMTEIVKDVKKGPAFRKGHIIRPEDVEHLKRLGKDHIYVLTLEENEVHENEAAQIFAGAMAGENVEFNPNASEGKIALKAGCDGLLKIDKDRLLQFNLLGEVMCATLQTNTPVKKGESIAASRLIPLVGSRDIVEKAAAILRDGEPIVQVKKLPRLKFGLVITGSEVFYGRIEDKFEAVLREKVAEIGSEVGMVKKAPDDIDVIASEIRSCVDAGVDIVITSGGMSVDPDDVTRHGILKAGADDAVYGTPVLPGAMFLSGHLPAGDRQIPVLGLPACGMYHKITVLDLVLPRVMIGETIGRQEFAELGHGGLCRNCPKCTYPVCSFGK